MPRNILSALPWQLHAFCKAYEWVRNLLAFQMGFPAESLHARSVNKLLFRVAALSSLPLLAALTSSLPPPALVSCQCWGPACVSVAELLAAVAGPQSSPTHPFLPWMPSCQQAPQVFEALSCSTPRLGEETLTPGPAWPLLSTDTTGEPRLCPVKKGTPVSTVCGSWLPCWS